MKIWTKVGTMDDIDAMVEIEKNAMPNGGWYLYDNRFFFLEHQDNQGEMVLAYFDDVPVGIGQYSVLPDGSGWIETLRVKQEYQHQGAGREIYKRYMELAEETNAPSVALFTGASNVASKGLAEIYGFHLAATYTGYDLTMENFEGECPEGFRLVEDNEEAMNLIDTKHEGWGNFLVFNRTFLHYGKPLYEYLIQRKMIYTDGESVIVLGCRMLEERGWHIGFFDGDAEKCLAFAAAKTKEKGLPHLTVMFPPEREDLKELFSNHGYQPTGELIVMELERS